MANKVTVTVTPVYHNVYEVKEVFTDVNRELSTGEYDEFDPNKQFAGLSKRGKLLSIPKTKGPATIDNYPLMLDSTDKTVLRSNQSVLVTTSKPNIGVFIEPCRYASVHTCIDNTNLLPRYTTDRNKVLTATYASVAVESVALALKYHAIYTSFLLLHNYGYTLLIPITVQLTTKEWHELGRYIFTGQPTGSYEDTVPYYPDVNQKYISSVSYLWLEGKTPTEVEQINGIKGTPAYADITKSPIMLGFDSITITAADKAKKIHPLFASITRCDICTYPKGKQELFVRITDVLNNPRLLETLKKRKISLNHEKTALSIPSSSSNSLLDTPVQLTQDQWGRNFDNQYWIPASATWVPNSSTNKKFDPNSNKFIPVKSVARSYKLQDVTLYKLQLNLNESPITGNWVLQSDIAKLSKRNRQVEQQELNDRKLQLETLYGQNLPHNWQNVKDEVIAQYFELQAKLATGALIDTDKSDILPEFYTHKQEMIDWLTLNNLTVHCPVTHAVYMEDKSLDELCQIPGFMKMLTDMLNENRWIKTLILSQSVQTLCVADML